MKLLSGALLLLDCDCPRRILLQSEDASKLKGKERKEWFCALARMRKATRWLCYASGVENGFEVSGGFFWHGCHAILGVLDYSFGII